jgi:hypothetical protein
VLRQFETEKGDHIVMVTLFILLDPPALASAGWSPDNLRRALPRQLKKQ